MINQAFKEVVKASMKWVPWDGMGNPHMSPEEMEWEIAGLSGEDFRFRQDRQREATNIAAYQNRRAGIFPNNPQARAPAPFARM